MIILGLGNIGREYERTRHNVGFMCIDMLADKLGVKFKDKECKSLTASVFKKGERIVLAKPETYMNLSGEALAELVGRYKEDISNVIVIYDDIDLDEGAIRVRKDGSAGTHNGMRNIVEKMKSKDIKRIRAGIGRPSGGMDLASYVLGRFSKESALLLDERFDRITNALIKYISDGDFEDMQRSLGSK